MVVHRWWRWTSRSWSELTRRHEFLTAWPSILVTKNLTKYRERIPITGHDEKFRLMGCMIDTDLRMTSCIEQFLSKIRPKISIILKIRDYYNVPDLIIQLKPHICGLIEMNIGGYFHACIFLIGKIVHARISSKYRR